MNDPQQLPPASHSEPPVPSPVTPEPGPPSVSQRWLDWGKRQIDARTIALLVLLLLLGALWLDTRAQIHGLQQELIRKLAEADSFNKESRQVAAQARDRERDLEYRLGTLEGRLGETENQRVALEGLYLELNRSRDERVLAEVEQILMIGSQQLTLAGNVKSALIALESADNRLQRSDSSQFTAIRRAIRRDIERLKSTPYVDVVGISLRLDSLAHQAGDFPLAMLERPSAANQIPVPANEAGWRRVAREAWQDVQALIRIQRVDRDEVPLITPPQSYFLRENLRLRLMSARVALLAHEEDSFKADARAASEWLQRYFDVKDRQVGQALGTLRQLANAEVSVDVPDISGSLEAVRNAKVVRERGLR
jgi:uroporphyrin-III C-methyltransferase